MNFYEDPFSSVRILNNPQKKEQYIEENNHDPFFSVRIPDIKEKEDGKSSIMDTPRAITGLAARGLESAIGIPEDYKKGFGGLLDLIIGIPTEYFSGKKQPKLRNFLRDPLSSLGKHREEIEELEKSSLLPGEMSVFHEYPSSENIKENITQPASEYFSGEKKILEPKGQIERLSQEVTQDIIRMVGSNSWMSKLGLSFASNSAKELSRQLGFSPTAQELTKLATLGILSLSRIGNAPKFAKELFHDTKNAMPRGVRIKTHVLENNIQKIKNSDWFKGHATPETNAAREMIQAIEKRIEKGSLDIHQAMTLRENINSMANNLGAFKVGGSGKTTHVSRLNEVRDALIDGMEKTVGKQYPKWWNQYQNANEAFAITKKSGAIANFIENNYAKPILSDTGKILFGNALSKGAAGIAKLGASAIALSSGSKAITLANRMKSPVLRKYYKEVIDSSLKSDGIAMAHALRKFDEEALKQEKKDKLKQVLYNPRQK